METFPRSGELKGEREAMRGRRPDDKLIVLIIHPSFAEIAAASGAERGGWADTCLLAVIRSKLRDNYTPTRARLGDHGAGPGLYELLVADKGLLQLT